jgi:ubiquinone/menaquinone biosynthesis C-methylase UbiE
MARIDYNAVAADYDRARGLPPDAIGAWRQALQPYFPPDERSRVLDLGAGTGVFARAFVSWFDAEIVAVEPSAGMRAEATRLSDDTRIAVIGGDAEHIPLRIDTCDAAWLSTMIHHVPDLGACAVELRRVLRNGAPVLIRSGFPGRADLVSLFRWFPEAARVVDTFPSVEAIIATFGHAGFAFERLDAIPQVSAPSLRASLERVRLRADTTLRGITDEAYAAGLARLEAAAAAELEPAPVVDHLDLLVLR